MSLLLRSSLTLATRASAARASSSSSSSSSLLNTATAAAAAARNFSSDTTPPELAAEAIPTYWNPHLPAAQQDKLLFTPGPLTTSHSVKAAMLRDLGSRDPAFIDVVKQVRADVITLAEVSPDEYTMVPVQGSGTFGIEAVVSSVVPKSKELLVLANGAYGLRIAAEAAAHGVAYHVLEWPEDTQPQVAEIDAFLKAHPNVSHVTCVHSETTSGIVNNIVDVGACVAAVHGRQFIVDAMSSFGAIPICFKAAHIDYLVTSANKCIEGVPGFAIVIARKSCLAETVGNESSLALALVGTASVPFICVYLRSLRSLRSANTKLTINMQLYTLGAPGEGLDGERAVSIYAADARVASVSASDEGARTRGRRKGARDAL
jgi:phosphoserine aminotransferase